MTALGFLLLDAASISGVRPVIRASMSAPASRSVVITLGF
jgi:hypothetical protein